MRKVKYVLPIIIIMALVASCATVKIPSAKEKLFYIYTIYNAQHEDYVRMAKDPATTEAQKEVMRKKKPILETLQTLIPMYDSSVTAGVPNGEVEQQIYDLINKLQSMAMGSV